MMKKDDILIRDPYVLIHEGKYYMYGTRSLTTWKKPDDLNDLGFDVYVSDDLENWSEPIEVFRRPDDFWSNQNFWAPEVHKYQGKFYMFATFYNADLNKRGTQILVADHPAGPFEIHSPDIVTPPEWACLDGTLYVDHSGQPYVVFCHEWTQIVDGRICYRKLSKDLTEPISEPVEMLKASEPTWSDVDAERYVTDGPAMFRTKTGELLMLWSSLKDGQYVEAIAKSDNGEIDGNWVHNEELLFSEDGGHGMLFHDLNDQLFLTLHSPNVNYHEHPTFIEVVDMGHTIVKK